MMDYSHMAAVDFPPVKTIGHKLAFKLGLTKLPEHFHTLGLSVLFFTFVHLVVSPFLSTKLFPVAYGERLKTRLARNTWAIHIVSQVHTLIVVPSALWVICHEPGGPDAWEKAFGWSYSGGVLHAIACGYFIWDTLDAIINFIDIGFVLHGLACTAVYLLSFRPFIAYYGRRCLLWEVSTFFLNIHWFLDKTGRTGTMWQLANGITLLIAFFGVRIVYGAMVSLDCFYAVIQVREHVPPSYTIAYGIGNIVLHGLNWYWFVKMIAALRKRFQAKEEVQPLLQSVDEEGIRD